MQAELNLYLGCYYDMIWNLKYKTIMLQCFSALGVLNVKSLIDVLVTCYLNHIATADITCFDDGVWVWKIGESMKRVYHV